MACRSRLPCAACIPARRQRKNPGRAATHHGVVGRDGHLPRVRGGGEPAAQLLRAEGLRPATTWRSCWRTTRRSWRRRAAQRSGLYYTAISSRLQADELAYIVGDCGAGRLHLIRLEEVAVAVADRTPAVKLWLMLDGHRGRLRVVRGRVAAYPPTPIEDECEGRTCSTPRARPGGPRASNPPPPRGPWVRRACLDQHVSFLSSRTRNGVPVAGAAVPRRAAAVAADLPSGSARRSVVMERFDAGGGAAG